MAQESITDLLKKINHSIELLTKVVAAGDNQIVNSLSGGFANNVKPTIGLFGNETQNQIFSGIVRGFEERFKRIEEHLNV